MRPDAQNYIDKHISAQPDLFAPRRESGEGSAAGSAPGVDLCCGCGYRFDLSLGAYGCPNCEGDNGPAVSCQMTIMSSGQANAEIRVDGGAPALTCLHEAPIIAHATQGVMAPVAFPANLSGTQHASAINLAPSLGAKNPTAVAFTQNQRNEVRTLEVAGALAAEPGMKQQTYLATASATVAVAFTTEQTPKFNRYKALGNSMAVPVMRWIGMRIDEALIASVKSVMGESDGH